MFFYKVRLCDLIAIESNYLTLHHDTKRVKGTKISQPDLLFCLDVDNVFNNRNKSFERTNNRVHI